MWNCAVGDAVILERFVTASKDHVVFQADGGAQTYERTLKALEQLDDEYAVAMFTSHSDAKTQSAVEASEKMVETWIRTGAADLKIKDPMKDAKTKNKCYDRAKEMEKQEGVSLLLN